MTEGIKPIRRVVTGNDAQGRSRVLYDSAAPRVKASAFKKGTGMTDIWMFETSPAPISSSAAPTMPGATARANPA